MTLTPVAYEYSVVILFPLVNVALKGTKVSKVYAAVASFKNRAFAIFDAFTVKLDISSCINQKFCSSCYFRDSLYKALA